ncbi:hypothetical protein [Thauera sp. 2A1]|uniref:hypothetical protein n=1 Tax=Thauera sp. 2A1 TaxID=2570191 RepID=UPI001D175762|nr:hypothetical protein [Thauera sp. 2A1]KAI5914332.1 hypothetical protein GH664_13970 [Thauera sp. 2A1]
MNKRQRSPRTVASTTLPALDHRIDTADLGVPRAFQNGTDMNPAHFRDVRSRVTLFAKHEPLATDMFEGFGRQFSGIDLFHARIMSKPI